MLPATLTEQESATLMVYPQTLSLQTREAPEFIDVTDLVSEVVQRSRVRSGLVNIQSLHTTAPLFVNENEPLLVQDMKDLLERWAPRAAAYRHDDFARRTVNLCPDEAKNGYAHCQAMLMKASATLNILDGALHLGSWQRIFLVELDGARERKVSVLVMGHAVFDGRNRRP